MKSRTWSNSTVDYGRKLFSSGVEGARSGREAFLHGKPLTPFLSESVQHAIVPAAIGAFLGVLSTYSGNHHRRNGRTLAYGLLGGAIGFGAGVAWETRHLTESVASAAWEQMGRIRDEHWLEKNPIDYA